MPSASQTFSNDRGHAVRLLADRAATTVVLQILAAADVNPPLGGSLRLLDSETDEIQEVRIDAGVAGRYRANLAA